MCLIVLAKIDPSTVAILVAIFGPLGAYLAAARKMSGKIQTTEATDLWKESSAIREWATGRVKELSEHIEKLEAQLNELTGINAQLAQENREKDRTIYELRNRITQLQAAKAELERALEEGTK